MVGRLVTIGVYESTLDGFLDALQAAGVDVLLDVRQRRGVRGPQYAWANSQRLQRAIAEAGIAYRHLKELAPTTAMRQAQYAVDAAKGEGKRSRTKLSEEYKTAYEQQILAPADLDELFGEFDASITAALMCVERDARACHRGLLAARLSAEFGIPVEHLLP